MNIIKFSFKSLICILFFFNAYSEEIQFEASEIDILDDGKTIIGKNVNITVPSKKFKINSIDASYNKEENVIIFKNNVFFEDFENNLEIKSNEIVYKRKDEIIIAGKETELNIENNYKINSDQIFYDRNLNTISGVKETLVEDSEKNFYILKDDFDINVNDEILRSNKAIILDKNFNKYIFENLFINLGKNEIAGKEIKVEFEKSYFGNIDNDPSLKGRSAYSNDQELKVYKAVFSTCNIENKKCRGWELSTNEFKHDKKNKIFEYKDSWLKIFDKRVFYLPYFNHPDPSVERKSGFLTPTYSTSETLGTSVNIPYFKTLGVDKDMTFRPKVYADKSFLLQNEYRQALRNSKIITDLSFLVGETGSKGHLFFNQIGQFSSRANFELNLQSVKGDNYLKIHDLNDGSPLINDNNLLISNMDINWNFANSDFSTSFKVFEDLSRNYHDRYQYIFPDYSFRKNIEIPSSYNGKFDFYSYGYNKNYDTNITEAVLTNDFIFSSNDYVSSRGISSNYQLLLKNSNDYIDKSVPTGEDKNYNLFGTFKIDAKLPMQKRIDNYTHYLNPILSFRYSPNGNDNLSSEDIKLNYNNVFELNRINSTTEVEGGEAVSIGLDFQRKNNIGKNIVDFKVANVLRLNENNNLPSKSKLNKTRSDIFGELKYKLNEYSSLGYNFSYDSNLKYTNLDQVNLEFGVNNFLTNFYYYSEDNDFGDAKNFRNKTDISLDKENKFSFEYSKDLNDDFTQYYDLIYTYQTDCISFNFNYNKSFYRDGNLEPNKSLSFLIKIIPFTELGVPNVRKIVNN